MKIEEWHHDQPEVKDEEKLESGREVGKGGVQWVGHLGSEVDHLYLIDQKLIILIILIRNSSSWSDWSEVDHLDLIDVDVDLKGLCGNECNREG